MKRSFDHSFVQLNDARDIPTIPSRSLRPNSATLATHPYYAPSNLFVNDYATPPTSYIYETPYAATHYLLQDHTLGNGDYDLQSNIWYQSTGTPEHNFWRGQDISAAVTPSRQSLAGLGITFGHHATLNSLARRALREPHGNTNRLPSDSEGSMSTLQSRKRKACVLDDDDSPMGIDGASAYSSCPGQDYSTRSPSGILDPSPFCRSYSPADDLLMLVDPITPSLDDIADLSHSCMVSTPGLDIVAVHDLSDTEQPIIGLVADVNYRALALEAQSPVMCVNPADISVPMDLSVVVKVEEDSETDLSPSASLTDHDSDKDTSQSITTDIDADFPEDALTAVVSVLAESVKQEKAAQIKANADHMDAQPQDGFSSACALPPHMRPYSMRTGDTLSSQLQPLTYPTRSGFGLGIHVPTAGAPQRIIAPVTTPTVLRPVTRRIPLAPVAQIQAVQGQVQHRPAPIANAHEGVELEDLRLRAETFRMLNPGCELDKTFLQSFAGRLSQEGFMLPEFRCYVKGCTQRNKRRDHILVHVGSHVEHRPFQCPQCGMRFLRKNECKRHMSSHAGFKPFICTLCAPYQEKSFVRQDLLKRHMKVTHGVKPDFWPDRRRRKTAGQEEIEASPAGDDYTVDDVYMMDMVSQ